MGSIAQPAHSYVAGPVQNLVNTVALPAPIIPAPPAPYAAIPPAPVPAGPAPADTVVQTKIAAPVRTHTRITPQYTNIVPQINVQKYNVDVPVAVPRAVPREIVQVSHVAKPYDVPVPRAVPVPAPYKVHPLQPSCCDRSCYPSPCCFSCSSRLCSCCSSCRCCCWICRCSPRSCLCYPVVIYQWQPPPMVSLKIKTPGCATQSDRLPVQCSKCFCSEGSFSLSFSGLATLIPPTSIRGKPGKLVYLEMHNFNQYLFCLDLCIL